MTGTTAGRLRHYVRRHRSAYILGVGCLVGGIALSMTAPVILRHAVDGLGEGATPRFLFACAIAILAFAVSRGLFTFVGRRRVIEAARHIEYELRNDVFAHVQRLGPSFFARQPAGDLTSRLINDIDGVRLFLGFGLLALISTSLTFAFSITMMFVLAPKLAGIALAPLLLVAVVLALTEQELERRSRAVQDELGDLSTCAQENFSGARIVRAFGQEDSQRALFRRRAERYRGEQVALARARARAWALMAVLAELTVAIALVLGGLGMIRHSMSKGTLLAFAAYEFMLVWPLIALGWVVSLYQRAKACAQRLDEVWRAEPEVVDPPLPADGVAAPPLLLVKNLAFGFEGRAVLEDISLEIPPGAFVVLVGRTGAGKSTLLGLLTRLHPTPPGTVFLGGIDVTQMPLAELRRRVGCVPQDDFLFSDTLAANILFGSANGAEEPEVLWAAGVARLDRDVERFPNRYQEVVGERGIMLSGGQKQRACLARGVVRRPDVLLIDDGLSHVDVEVEQEILDRLRAALGGRSCLFVTHRLLAAVRADRVYVLDGGRVAESGRHEDLLRSGGLYARLWDEQRLRAEIERI